MSNVDARCLDAFPEWLRSLGKDALSLAAIVEDTAEPEFRRKTLAGALNYLFKSLDLIPDGIEDLGFLDDAFVFRVAAQAAVGEGETETLTRLAGDTALLTEFLGGDYARLERFVSGLENGSARGRSVEQIVSDSAARNSLVSDVKGWASSYVVPSFGRDAKNLVKLKSFLGAKLPA